MDEWADFYERLFNFREIRYFDIEGKLTGLKSKAMTSPCGKIRIPINESSDDKSQIQEYLVAYHGEGIQHVALGTDDIYRTVEALRSRGVAFQDTPETYYDLLATRLPGHKEDLARLKRNHILLDGAPAKDEMLLQIFTSTGDRADLFRDHPAQGQRRLRRRQFPRAVRIDRAGPDPSRRAEGLSAPAAGSEPGRAFVLSPAGIALLRRLSDGAFHSGETLAQAVGLSRARVSQLLRHADEAGVQLERVRGRGYRLLEATSFLDAAEVRRAGGPRLDRLALDVLDSIDSTNSELLRRATRVDVHRRVLAAEAQTAGRGRRGRSWTGVVGGSLAFSFGWRFECAPCQLGGLSLAVGVAVVRGLARAGFPGVALKWPNDLVHGERKLGGVLIELSGDGQGPSLAVIGVGVNVRLPQGFREAIAQPVIDLAGIDDHARVDRNAVLAAVLEAMDALLEQYANEGFSSFRAEWERYHVLQGKAARVVLPDGSAMDGVVAGVDGDGALLLDGGGRRLRYVNGEVSLRAA